MFVFIYPTCLFVVNLNFIKLLLVYLKRQKQWRPAKHKMIEATVSVNALDAATNHDIFTRVKTADEEPITNS